VAVFAALEFRAEPLRALFDFEHDLVVVLGEFVEEEEAVVGVKGHQRMEGVIGGVLEVWWKVSEVCSGIDL